MAAAGAARLADRRAGQSRARVRAARATTSASWSPTRSPSVGAGHARRSASAGASPKAAGRSPDALASGPAGPRSRSPRESPARGGAVAADLHERRRPLGRPGARRVQAPAGARAGRARRDRPAVRRGAHPPGRRSGGPQRPEVDQARSWAARTSCACASAWAARARPTRRSSPPTCSAASARRRQQVARAGRARGGRGRAASCSRPRSWRVETRWRCARCSG